MKFTEAQLEQAFIELLRQEDIPHVLGGDIARAEDEVLIKEDLKAFLLNQYKAHKLIESEADQIIRQLEVYSSSDLYESNKAIMKLISDGFALKREDRSQKDIWIYLIDYSEKNNNTYKIVNQLEITGYHKRIPDGILYINGIPLVVLEFKTAVNENVSIHDAYIQLTTRYKRDIPELFKYNAFCVISDGVNSKAGSFFAPYEFFYAWRKVEGLPSEVDGINSMLTLIQGMFNHDRLRDIIRNFVFIPDTSKKDEKIVCRYPQYYATRKLFQNILLHQKPNGDGKGGTYFGTTGCGKSFTMLFLTRLLMKSKEMSSPTIVLITDRTDLDDQLSGQFTNAKGFIGDNVVKSVETREDLRLKLNGRKSGGVFLTTIHKFNEDTDVLTQRTNVICISDEAHRSQINLDQKITIDQDKGTVKKSYGFAKHLHDSLPNATYVGFTGTPVDATLDVFGDIVDSYTMTESVRDEITVRIVYEGRAAKMSLNNSVLKDIENYYQNAVAEGASEYHVEKSKKESSNMNMVLGDPDRLEAIAKDFVQHYETRVAEGSSVAGKAMFVCSSRPIAYKFYTQVINLRPEWAEIKPCAEGAKLTDKEKKEIKPMERIKMIMTRGKDDPKEMYEALGDKAYRKELDRQFKNEKSNFKIAIVVDMWLTGFDVPFLDTMYIDKPVQRHNLIQTISRVNRRFTGKGKGLIVDYIGIKKEMNQALAIYNKVDNQNFEDIESSIVVVKDYLDLLENYFHGFDSSDYFTGQPLAQLQCLNGASEFVLSSEENKRRFMDLVKRLKSAYDICSGSNELTEIQKDFVHFYLAIRSIVHKLTKGLAPDTEQMNAYLREKVAAALESDGIEEIIKLGDEENKEQDIFDLDYLANIEKIKLPNTKIQLLQNLLKKAIGEMKKVNRIQGVEFSKKMQAVVDRYNERKDNVYSSEEFEEIANELTTLIMDLKAEFASGDDLGIDFEEKAFYDILKSLANKYDFSYPDDRLLHLAKEVKVIVDDKSRYTDWSERSDIKAELKVDLILLLGENDYPPVDRDEVYKEIFEQAENFKRNR
ncbi:type I restriction endonuclease subunit R [Schleiferiaceae bacterium]|nr:type I restriction endonuclease subunit R [Schleiferiaceae bacterium]